MKLIDTHAHLTFEDLEKQVDAVLARSVAACVTQWITIGTDKGQNEKVLILVEGYDRMWAALGYHPHYANDITDADMAFLKEQLQHAKIVAVGECGLDYQYDNVVAGNQQRLFRQHLDIAAELQKPVIVHTRDAFDDTMGVLSDYTGKLKNVVIHCYDGDVEQTQRVLDCGYYISFTGTVTFKRSEALREVAKMIPLEKLMIETDCPYISPHPVRNIRPNEPALLIHTAQCLADVHGIPLDDFAEKVTKTSEAFFGLRTLSD